MPRTWTNIAVTWQVTCSYSQFRASLKPTCCVSLSTFYNDTVVSCPHCSCGCQGPPSASQCARQASQSILSFYAKKGNFLLHLELKKSTLYHSFFFGYLIVGMVNYLIPYNFLKVTITIHHTLSSCALNICARFVYIGT